MTPLITFLWSRRGKLAVFVCWIMEIAAADFGVLLYRFIKAALGAENFRKHVPMIVDETHEFFERNASAPTGIIDVHEFFSKLIINTASRCLMGKEIRANLEDGPVAKLYYDLDQGFQPINMMFPNLPLPSYKRRDEANLKMTKLYASIIKRRRDEDDNVRQFLKRRSYLNKARSWLNIALHI